MMRILLIIGLLIGTIVAVGISYGVTHSSHFHQNVTSSSGAITGRVLDSNGQPVSGARVYALRSDFTMGRIFNFYTDEQGVFLIKDLTPGTYKIFAAKETDGYAPTDNPFYSIGLVEPPLVTVYEQQTTSDITVYLGPKAAKLIGRIVDAITSKPIAVQGKQITLRRVGNPDCSYTTGPDLKGNFNILIPPVPVTVEVSVLGHEKKHLGPLHLKPEEIKRLDFSLRPEK